MLLEEFHFRKELISKKRMKKLDSRSKKFKECTKHGIVGPHVVDNNGNLADYLDFCYLKRRKDYELFKGYNKQCLEKLSICNGHCDNKDRIEDNKRGYDPKDFNDRIIQCKEKKEKLKSNSDDNCPICMEKLKGRLIKKFGCSHQVCLKCYDKLVDVDCETKKIQFEIDGIMYQV